MSAPNESRLAAPLDVENIIPKVPFIRIQQLAKIVACSPQHVVHLIENGDIVVPAELQSSAPSKTAIRIPRESLINFMRERSSPEWHEARRREREAR